MTVVGVTGHRPDRITDPGWVKSALSSTLRDLSASRLLMGMANGVDMWAAGEAWRLDIPFVAVRPWRGHGQTGPGYEWCLRHAVDVISTSEATSYPGPQCYHTRNHWIVDHCAVLVAVWDGKKSGGTWQAVKYAQGHGKPLAHINPVERTIHLPGTTPDESAPLW